MTRDPDPAPPPDVAGLERAGARLRRAYEPDRFEEEAAQAVRLVRAHLDGALERKRTVWPSTPPEELLSQWPDPEQAPPAQLGELLERILEQSTSQHHPGFVGQQLSAPPTQAGPVAMVWSVLNNSLAIFEGAPVAVALERRVVRWMIDKIGYGTGAGGALTSGGTLGALTALLAMRQARIGGDVWQDGLSGEPPCAIFVSAEAHYCNRRAASVLGLGGNSVVPVPVDDRFRIDPRSLPELLETTRRSGRRPVALIANAGSTSTGSHDDLDALADVCAKHDLWLHVDAAHGGGALLSRRYAHRLRGIERADSVVWDAHKMMLMPNLCTGVLFKDARHLDSAFRQDAAYLLDDRAPWYQPAARNFETTKPAMSVPLYVALRTLGAGFLAEALDYAYDLARWLAAEIERREPFELLVPPESNIVCFRRRTADEDVDALQERLRRQVNHAGRFFIQRTRARDATWLRVVLMNPLTTPADLRLLLDELAP